MTILRPINKRTSGLYVGTFRDELLALVDPAILTTATLSLFALQNGVPAYVNGWHAKDIKNVNGWTFYNTLQSIIVNGKTVTYNVAWEIAPADGQVLEPALRIEPHIAEVQLTWSGGTRGVTHAFTLPVNNMYSIN